MKKPVSTPVFAERIDKLTRSIENALTGESFPTEVRPLSAAAARKLKGWAFEWSREAATPGREVYQLTTSDNPTIIQGLISLEAKPDHVFMHLVESANFNKGRGKAYFGILGNLVAYACRWSFELGHDGYVSFESKSRSKRITNNRWALKSWAACVCILETRPPWHLLGGITPAF